MSKSTTGLSTTRNPRPRHEEGRTRPAAPRPSGVLGDRMLMTGPNYGRNSQAEAGQAASGSTTGNMLPMATEAPSEITREAARLEEALGSLHQVVDILGERLEMVMDDVPVNETVADAEPVPLSPLGRRLRDASGKVVGVEIRIQRLLRRLALP